MATVNVNHIDTSDNIRPKFQFFYTKRSFSQRDKNQLILFLRQMLMCMVFCSENGCRTFKEKLP